MERGNSTKYEGAAVPENELSCYGDARMKDEVVKQMELINCTPLTEIKREGPKQMFSYACETNVNGTTKQELAKEITDSDGSDDKANTCSGEDVNKIVTSSKLVDPQSALISHVPSKGDKSNSTFYEEMHQYTSRLAESLDSGTHTTGTNNSATTASSGTLPSFVQEAIHNFNEASKKPDVQYRQWPGITWSKWDVRPEGVKESVAQVIPQPSVSFLSKKKTTEEIHVKKVNPFCMDELLGVVCNVDSGNNPSHHEQFDTKSD